MYDLIYYIADRADLDTQRTIAQCDRRLHTYISKLHRKYAVERLKWYIHRGYVELCTADLIADSRLHAYTNIKKFLYFKGLPDNPALLQVFSQMQYEVWEIISMVIATGCSNMLTTMCAENPDQVSHTLNRISVKYAITVGIALVLMQNLDQSRWLHLITENKIYHMIREESHKTDEIVQLIICACKYRKYISFTEITKACSRSRNTYLKVVDMFNPMTPEGQKYGLYAP